MSLIELLVALTLGLVLLGLVIQVFSSQRQTFSAGQALARVQENNRFAAELIREPARALALQGFCGGNARYRNHINLTSGDQPLSDPRRVVGGWEYTGTGAGDDFTVPTDLSPTPGDSGNWTGRNMGALPAAIANRVAPFSDVLLIREIRPVFGIWADIGSLELEDEAFQTNVAHGIRRCATVLMTNCVRTDVFQNTAGVLEPPANDPNRILERGASGCAPGNVTTVSPRTGRWQDFYGDDAHIYEVIAHAFFVALNPQTNEPGLHRISFDGRAVTPVEELVSGVETLQVLFGYSAPSPVGDGQQVDRWWAADQVENWELVIAIRLDAIVRSDVSVGTGRVAVEFEIGENATVTMPNDQLLRQPVNATMALRTRMITQ